MKPAVFEFCAYLVCAMFVAIAYLALPPNILYDLAPAEPAETTSTSEPTEQHAEPVVTLTKQHKSISSQSCQHTKDEHKSISSQSCQQLIKSE